MLGHPRAAAASAGFPGCSAFGRAIPAALSWAPAGCLTCGWERRPAAVPVDEADATRLAVLMRWCLSREARTAAAAAASHAQPALRRLRERFLGLFRRPAP